VSSAYLADYIENAEYELQVLVPALKQGELDLRGIHLLCDTYRQRGVCSFLLTGGAQVFHLNCMQSSSAYLQFLATAERSQSATSQAKPFYDAVGSGYWDCARDIAVASRMNWNPAKEYEDDFLFVLFLLKHFFLDAVETECRHIISQHESVAEGADQAHRDVCLAFLDRDPALFDESLREILQVRAHRVEGMVAREAIPEEHWSWLRYFSSEGLALLKLAERAGLATDIDYLNVSESLRRSPEFDFDPEAWRNIGYEPQPR